MNTPTAQQVVTDYRGLAGVGDLDHLLAATGPTSTLAAKQALPGADVRVGRGVDGADLALLAQVDDVTSIARRYRRVVIGSGDHRFAGLARQLRSMGVRVEVVGRPGSIARALLVEADAVTYLSTETSS